MQELVELARLVAYAILFVLGLAVLFSIPAFLEDCWHALVRAVSRRLAPPPDQR